MKTKIYHQIRIWLAVYFKFLQKHLLSEDERMRLHILEIRSNMKVFGHDLSDLTDDQIIEGSLSFGRAVVRYGITAEECVSALMLIQKSIK